MVVGAPMYSQLKDPIRVEQGRAYVFFNNGSVSNQSILTFIDFFLGSCDSTQDSLLSLLVFRIAKILFFFFDNNVSLVSLIA